MIYILGVRMNECTLLNNVMEDERIETQVFIFGWPFFQGVQKVCGCRGSRYCSPNLEMIIVCVFWGLGHLANLI